MILSCFIEFKVSSESSGRHGPPFPAFSSPSLLPSLASETTPKSARDLSELHAQHSAPDIKVAQPASPVDVHSFNIATDQGMKAFRLFRLAQDDSTQES